MKKMPDATVDIAQAATKNVARFAHLALKVSVVATVCAVALATLAACSSLPGAQEALTAIKGSFSERGIAKLDRLDQTEIQRICSETNASGKEIGRASCRERV